MGRTSWGTAATAATTRTATAAAARADETRHLVAPEVIASAETGLRYRIGRLLGKGGFGQVYLATRLERSGTVPQVVGIKVSDRMDGWVREAYFGQLLDGHPRAIRLYDAFPLVRPGGQVLYCLALEYARHGDLSTALQRGAKGWTEAAARREIAGHPPGARHAAPRTDAPPRPDPDERVRLRRTPPEARRLRHRPPAAEQPRHHRAHAEPVDGAERLPRGRRAEVAGA